MFLLTSEVVHESYISHYARENFNWILSCSMPCCKLLTYLNFIFYNCTSLFCIFQTRKILNSLWSYNEVQYSSIVYLCYSSVSFHVFHNAATGNDQGNCSNIKTALIDCRKIAQNSFCHVWIYGKSETETFIGYNLSSLFHLSHSPYHFQFKKL